MPAEWLSIERREKIEASIQKTSLEKIEDRISELNVHIYPIGVPEYPKSLTHLSRPPHVLYVRGALPHDSLLPLGIVGSRSHTLYGKQVLESLVKALPQESVSIISGGAYGIDSIAHELALKHHIHTVSVFGCGVDVYYPQKNAHLFESILENQGAIVSIFPL